MRSERIKFSISTSNQYVPDSPILLYRGIEENLVDAAALGYDAIEVHMRENENIDIDTIKRVMHERNVSISALITGKLNTEGKVNLIDDVSYIQEAALKGVLKYIEIASQLETNIVIGWVKGKLPSKSQEKKYLSKLSEQLDVIDSRASEKNVKVFLEVINRYETNIFNTTEEVLRFIKKHSYKNIYVHLDTFHMNIEESDPVNAVEECGELLGYFHVADNTRTYPGSGTINFENYLRVLNKINYSGYISVECLPIPDAKTAAIETLKYMKKLVNRSMD